MLHQIPLRRFVYCFTDPNALSTFEIDLEKRSLSLDGEGIQVKAGMSPGFGLDLSGQADHVLVFSLEGILDDGKTINTCSGLLILQNVVDWKDRSGAKWEMTVYLYDDLDDDREIKFHLCTLPLSENAVLN